MTWLLCMAAAVLLQRGALLGLRAAWLAHEPVSGEHTDSVVYHRSLWTPGEAEVLGTAGLLLLSGLGAAAGLQFKGWPLWPAGLLWLGAVAWDLWTWERVAASVKFVSWRRGWRHSARRVAVSDLKEVNVVERRSRGSRLPAWARPTACYLALVMRDGKAVKLPRTGALFGGEAEVERLANFVRMQMDVVADNRRRAAADKRSEARRALLPQMPMHPASKLDPLALNRGGPG
ncbi:hypothetical protein [Methylibium sp.]|uniref:hypothetical protein n=1 Tax=Methylibium sp. TaxID=2067992 RepID=UPI003D0A0D52